MKHLVEGLQEVGWAQLLSQIAFSRIITAVSCRVNSSIKISSSILISTINPQTTMISNLCRWIHIRLLWIRMKSSTGILKTMSFKLMGTWWLIKVNHSISFTAYTLKWQVRNII
jgi:hypothetical protein